MKNRLEDILNKLRKSESDEFLDEDQEERDELDMEKAKDYEVDDEDEVEEEEVEGAPEDGEAYDVEDDEPIMETDAPEEDEGADEPEAEKEDFKNPDDEEVVIDFEDLVAKVSQEVRNEFEGWLQDLQSQVEQLTEAVNLSADKFDQTDRDIGEITKSMGTLNRQLSAVKKARKSISNARMIDKFATDKDELYDHMTKSERASVLVAALEAGNSRVSANDVLNAEMGKPISESAKEVILNSIG